MQSEMNFQKPVAFKKQSHSYLTKINDIAVSQSTI